MYRIVLLVWLITTPVEVSAAAQDASSAQSQSRQNNTSSREYTTFIQSSRLPSSDLFLFQAITKKKEKKPHTLLMVHQVIQKEDEEGYEIYSDLRTDNSASIDPAVAELIREHESNLLKHFVIFLDDIDPALVKKFLCAKQVVKSIIVEKSEQKGE